MTLRNANLAKNPKLDLRQSQVGKLEMRDPQKYMPIFKPEDDPPIRTPFPLCFRGQILKLLEIEAAGRVLASAQKTPQ